MRRAAKTLHQYNHSLYTCCIKNCIECAEHFILNPPDTYYEDHIIETEVNITKYGIGYILLRPKKILLTFISTPKEPTSFEVLHDYNFSNKLWFMTKLVPNKILWTCIHTQTIHTLKDHLTTSNLNLPNPCKLPINPSNDNSQQLLRHLCTIYY